MKKILFVNGELFIKGHYDFDMKMIYLFSQIAEISVANPNRWYDLKSVSCVKDIPLEIKNKQGTYKRNYLSNIGWICKISKHIRKNRYDLIFFSDVHDYQISLLLFCTRNKKKIAIMHHNSLDKINKGLHKILFSYYKDKVLHITYEEYMDLYLKEVAQSKNVRSMVIHHSLPFIECRDDFRMPKIIEWDSKMINVVSLSSTSDESFFNALYEHETRTNDLRKNNIRVIVKLKSLPPNYLYNENFIVIVDRLSDEEYWRILNNADCSLIYYKNSFKYRSSGYLSDSLYCKKPCILRESIMAESYKEKYPHICYSVSDIDELINIVRMHPINENTIRDSKEFDKYRLLHSDESITTELKRVLLAEG